MKLETCRQCSREVMLEYQRESGRTCVLCVGDRNRQDADRMRDLIRELKQGPNEDRKREVLRDITALNHPDVSGLVKAIEDRASAPAAPRRRAA